MNLLRHGHSLLVLDRGHFLLAQVLTHDLIITQVELCANENDRNARGVVQDFREPLQAKSAGKLLLETIDVVYLRLDVVERRWADNGETY